MKTLLYVIIISHTLIVITGTIALILTIMNEPWYVSFLISTLTINLIFGFCPFTYIENCVRRQLKMPEIKYFIRDYSLVLWQYLRHRL
jgi:hypothetical protein